MIPYGHHLQGVLKLADPIKACEDLKMPHNSPNETVLLLVERGNCDFTEKVYIA